jgi:hypothetical protein
MTESTVCALILQEHQSIKKRCATKNEKESDNQFVRTFVTRITDVITSYVACASKECKGICDKCYVLRSSRIIHGSMGRLPLYRQLVALHKSGEGESHIGPYVAYDLCTAHYDLLYDVIKGSEDIVGLAVCSRLQSFSMPNEIRVIIVAYAKMLLCVSRRAIVQLALNIHELDLLHTYTFRHLCGRKTCTGWVSMNRRCNCGAYKTCVITLQDDVNPTTFSLLTRAPLSQAYLSC